MAAGALLVDRGWLRHNEMMKLHGPAGERGGPLPAKRDGQGTDGEGWNILRKQEAMVSFSHRRHMYSFNIIDNRDIFKYIVDIIICI